MLFDWYKALFQGLLHYHIPDPNIPLSRLFTVMERLKQTHPVVEDYIVSDTSLEEVFMSFARQSASWHIQPTSYEKLNI